MIDQRYADLLEQIQTHWVGLPDKPDETAEVTLQVLWRLAAGDPTTPAGQTSQPLPALDETGMARLQTLLARRLSGTPLAYLTGRQTFLGITMLASPQAMIPRKETEILGKVAVETIQHLEQTRGITRAVDVCTGSGNIALAISANAPQAQVWGIDLSPEAVQLAAQNAEFLHLAGRVTFLTGDLFAPLAAPDFASSFDLVTCNPPYISSAQVDRMAEEIHEHEPRLAFDGGPFGIKILTRIIREAPTYLNPGGYLCFECGLGQGKNMVQMVNRQGYLDVETFTDQAGDIRVIRARTRDTL